MSIEKKKKKKKSVVLAIVHIKATFNNTIVTFTDSQGNTIVSSSSGGNGFKGARKSTPYAAQVSIGSASNAAKEHGVQTVSIQISGAGSQREAALRSVFAQNFVVTQVSDVSALPHNGVRSPKKRRV